MVRKLLIRAIITAAAALGLTAVTAPAIASASASVDAAPAGECRSVLC